MSRKKTDIITFNIIKEELLQELASMRGWIGSPEIYNQHYFRARAMLELLEVARCGSVGGFDDGQSPCIAENIKCLIARTNWFLLPEDQLNPEDYV